MNTFLSLAAALIIAAAFTGSADAKKPVRCVQVYGEVQSGCPSGGDQDTHNDKRVKDHKVKETKPPKDTVQDGQES